MPRGNQHTGEPWPQRFWNRAEPEPNTGCWLWTGANKGNGYGMITFNGRGEGAHRMAWMLHNERPIPAGMFVLHRCDNGNIGCVNPLHLFLGTAKDNSHDARRKGRLAGQKQVKVTHCRHGHEFTPQNTYADPKRPGIRHCRTCRRGVKVRARAALGGGR